MKRVNYPLEQLKEYIKGDGIEKLLYLMKRNNYEKTSFNYDSGLFGFYYKITSEGDIIQESTNINGTRSVGDSVNFNDFIGETNNAEELIKISNLIKDRVCYLMKLEEDMLSIIDRFNELKVGTKPRLLITEKTNI